MCCVSLQEQMFRALFLRRYEQQVPHMADRLEERIQFLKTRRSRHDLRKKQPPLSGLLQVNTHAWWHLNNRTTLHQRPDLTTQHTSPLWKDLFGSLEVMDTMVNLYLFKQTVCGPQIQWDKYFLKRSPKWSFFENAVFFWIPQDTCDTFKKKCLDMC